MELSFQTDTLECYDLIFSQRVRKEETQDSVVPDTLPDIAEIQCVSGSVLIRSKDVGAGYIRLESNVPARICYRAEDTEELYPLEVNIPFTVNLEDPSIPDGGICVAEMKLAVLEAKLLNPRKVSVRAAVNFCVDCYFPGQKIFFGGGEREAEAIHVREHIAAVTAVSGVSEKTFVLTDEFSVPGEVKNLLSQNTVLLLEELKTVGNKLILKGTAKSDLLVLAQDMSIGSVSFSTGFSQIMELENMPENAFLKVNLLLSGSYYDLSGGEERSSTMELHAVAQAVVYSTSEHSCITDAYSNRFHLETETEEGELCRIKGADTLRETVRDTLPTAAPVSEVLQGVVDTGIPQMEGEDLTLPITVSVHYRTADGTAAWTRRSLTARFHHELDPGRYLEIADILTQEIYLAPGSGGIEMRLPLEISVFLWEKEPLPLVRGVRFDETEVLDLSELPSLVILRGNHDETLWELAKGNASTVEAIQEANALDQPVCPSEMLLIIPKVV